MTLTRRIELQVLVLSARDVGTGMVKAQLSEVGVPFTEIDLEDPSRPQIDEAFLCRGSSLFVRQAAFQALVLPNEAPVQLRPAERAALDAFQREFNIRRLDSYVYPSAAVQLQAPVYAGSLDGLAAQPTDAGRNGPFGYLAGPVSLDDQRPDLIESYGYLAVPLPPLGERSFTPLVQVRELAVIGVYRDSGREEMVITAALNAQQLQAQALFPGVLRWLTRGVHFGSERQYLTVHVDDVFLGDARWIPAHHCTRGNDCPPGVSAPDIQLQAADVEHLLAWQARNAFVLDMVYNGGGYAAWLEDHGSFAAAEPLIARRSELRWINHTYSHEYLGCVRDLAAPGLPCAFEPSGAVRWVAPQTIDVEIGGNVEFARQYGLPIRPDELVTGEHSGLRRAPAEPVDNPYFVAALEAGAIAWVASDASREPAQREVGAARSVPRYPLNLYFNVGTRGELVDEFNWIHCSAADGGSGACERDPRATCLLPVPFEAGFERELVPREARAMLLRALSNDPRPHYVHQSNVAEERLLYPLLERVLAEYRKLFGPDAPLIQLRFGEAGLELLQQASWRAYRHNVTGYIEAGRLTISVSSSGALRVPLTLPLGAQSGGVAVLPRYAGQQTGWRSVKPLLDLAFELPASVGYAR
ncbi:MAG TPA: hypothetical protein VJV78_02460 [Polyangiales bacterium]|nr:hypothetical protein [Polyangiales bacterium]